MSVMSILNEFLYSTTARTRIPCEKAPRSDDTHSSMLFQQILRDIAEKKYKAPPESFDVAELWEEAEGDNRPKILGYALVADPRLSIQVQNKLTADFRELLRDIQVEDHERKLMFDIRSGAVAYDTKMDLFSVLRAYVRNPDNHIRSADQISSNFKYHRGIPKDVQGAEFISENVRSLRNQLETNEDLAKDLFFSVECKPYLSEQHYLFASGVSGIASIMVSMDHLLKTICTEDGLPIPDAIRNGEISGERRAFPLSGGYN